MEQNNITSSYLGKGIGKRLGAAIIDGLIFIFLTTILSSLLDSVGIFRMFNLSLSQVNVAVYILSGIYFVYLEAVYGQTLGKKIFKLKVINISKPTSRGLGWLKAITRSVLKLFVLCYFASLASFRAGEVSGMYAILSAVEIFLFNKTKQGWYDVLSNTIVVKQDVALDNGGAVISKSKLRYKLVSVFRFILVFIGSIILAMSLIK